jgi:alanine racemase
LLVYAETVSLSKEEIAARGHPVWAEIDLAALRHNMHALRALASNSEVMGVVKGYAYGHGNPSCAAAMVEAGASRLGVARVAEALHLRQAGIEVPIHVFTEPPPEAVAALVRFDIIPTVYTQAFASALSDAARTFDKTVAVHVKIDTGMHRVGMAPDHVVDALRAIRSLGHLSIEGAWSHLAVADVPDHPFTRKQLDLFTDIVGQMERAGFPLRYRHLANSAATLSLPDAHFDIVRCGVAAYGLWPGVELVGIADLHPVMTLKARVNMVKQLPAGNALSYGLNYELKDYSRVVTVPIGYADGYDRGFSGLAEVLIGGRRYRVSGAVCMDQFMVDVGMSDVEVGEIVTLIGRDGNEHITAEELAKTVGTINYEVTSRIGARVPRLYLDDAHEQ